jgi:hypothetical protein
MKWLQLLEMQTSVMCVTKDAHSSCLKAVPAADCSACRPRKTFVVTAYYSDPHTATSPACIDGQLKQHPWDRQEKAFTVGKHCEPGTVCRPPAFLRTSLVISRCSVLE